MQQANQPPKFLQPLAQNDASKADIPVTSPDDTRASQSLGFPPRTGQPPEAGGVPPQLPDMNGVLNLASRPGWWAQLGGRFGYDSTFATNPLINGYPQGATLPAGDGLGDWISTANDNAVNPDTVGTGWVPGYSYGATALASQTGGTVTLTPAQARKRVLTVAGTLTSNLVLVVPNWRYDWTVYNNTGGAFSVTVRTAGGAGAVAPQNGAPTPVLCDGINCVLSAPNIGPATSTGQAMQLGQAIGRMVTIQRFAASGTYTPSAGVRYIIVELVGGGGGGAGVPVTSGTQVAVGGGGGGGAYYKFGNTVPSAPVAVTVGTGGAAGVSGVNAGAGGNGANTSFGDIASVEGGQGGAATVGAVASSSFLSPGGRGGTTTAASASLDLVFSAGGRGGVGTSLGNGATFSGAIGGEGGATSFTQNGAVTPSAGAPNWGGVGGVGAASGPNGGGQNGQPGATGLVLVYEFS